MSRPPIHIRFAHWLGRAANRVGDRWLDLVEPIERFFGRIGDRVLGVFDSFGALEAGVIRALMIVFWPIVFVGRLVSRLLPESEPGNGIRSWPGRAAHYAIGGAIWLAERLNLDRVLFFVAWLLTPLWWPLATLLGFLNAWVITRNTRELALGVPALLLAAPFVYVAVAGASQQTGQIASRYTQAVSDAVAAGDFDTAGLFERKLAQLGVDTRRTTFRDANALAEDGDWLLAYERMKILAPADRPGYAEAHGWIATNLLAGRLTAEHEPLLKDASQRLNLVSRHIEQLKTIGIEGQGVAQLRAHVLSGEGRFSEAAAEIAPFADRSVEVAAMRLRWLLAADDRQEARRAAGPLLRMYRSGVAARSESGQTDYLSWALAAELVRDDQQLEDALDRWRQADSKNAKPGELLGALRRRQLEQLLQTETANPEQVVERLCDAAALGSSREWIARQVATLAMQKAKSHSGQLAWDGLLQSPRSTDRLREIAATTAAGQGQVMLAREVFREMAERGVEQPTLWNNYAWTLANGEDVDLQAALNAANRACKAAPNDYRFRETRGQVFAKLKRWPEAISDLEFALNGMPESAEIHRSLAAAYDATSKPQLAELHRNQIRN